MCEICGHYGAGCYFYVPESLVRCEICGNYYDENRGDFYDIDDMAICENCIDSFIENSYIDEEPTDDMICIVCDDPCEVKGYYVFVEGKVCRICIDFFKELKKRNG